MFKKYILCTPEIEGVTNLLRMLLTYDSNNSKESSAVPNF